MATRISHSPAETEALGIEWGREAMPGLVVALSGDLGAGKTRLVTGLARGLGITERIHSPTFGLINIYTGGRLVLFHLDLYRLETPAQVAAAGLDEYLRPDGVAVIEWAERLLAPAERSETPFASHGEIFQSLPPLQGVRLRWADLDVMNETERRISYEDFGA
ncbi:MAG TPA: tRNA (adenosine(37)-N6)-threonylcarbamoyltransferase complex ATPase subunit type 1 TsaE [Verrucomicrobiae bacterium]|nr:tRNA (adenosine(37)-N6)-threonylcarbamoyltransferase complex ATPase subunit type 1 TsaE [Verrucomicrobiae bacterium]